ncbi:MAG: DinB family protein [Chloroflexi bacterium]|nr:DinB family protein [Chloroflexota bacterium]
MDSDMDEARNLMLSLLNVTRRETRLALFGIDSERVVHHDNRAWRVRDVVGHLGVWNGEAARSLRAYAEGGDYRCITSEAEYDEYNGAAADERRTWTIERVWAEYEASCDQLKLLVETMPVEKWIGKMLYPWNERGTILNLIEVMMKHEVDHREIVVKATS